MLAGPQPWREAAPVLELRTSQLSWRWYWGVVQRELRAAGFEKSTLLVYRQVLRSFKAFLDQRAHPTAPGETMPGEVTAGRVRDFVDTLVERHCSWSWVSTNITVLRTVLDKLGGLATTRRLCTPKRPEPLPYTLSVSEVQRMISAAGTARDRLIIGLLFGCGLKTGELCRIRWRDADTDTASLDVPGRNAIITRHVPLPNCLLPILRKGKGVCEPGAYMFPGPSSTQALTARTIERLIRDTARTAGIIKPVTCMTLRHSFAVVQIRAGISIRELQELLGHRNVETTLRYQRLLLADNVTSPADQLSLDGCPAPAIPCSQPSEMDLAIDAPSLAFPFEELVAGPRAFYKALKSRLHDRFMATRGFARAGPTL